MKIIAILLFIFAVGAFAGVIDTDNSKEKESFEQDGLFGNCMKAYDINEGDYKNISLETYLWAAGLCTMKRLGVLNDDGTLNEEFVKAKGVIPVEKIHSLLEKCDSAYVNRNNLQENIEYVKCLRFDKTLKNVLESPEQQ